MLKWSSFQYSKYCVKDSYVVALVALPSKFSIPPGETSREPRRRRRAHDEERTSDCRMAKSGQWSAGRLGRFARASPVPHQHRCPFESPPIHESVPLLCEHHREQVLGASLEGCTSAFSAVLFSRRKNSILITRRSEEKSAMRQRRGVCGSRASP